eukprot:gene27062-32699_t
MLTEANLNTMIDYLGKNPADLAALQKAGFVVRDKAGKAVTSAEDFQALLQEDSTSSLQDTEAWRELLDSDIDGDVADLVSQIREKSQQAGTESRRALSDEMLDDPQLTAKLREEAHVLLGSLKEMKAAAGVRSEDAVAALPAPPRDSPAAQLFSSLLLARLQEEVAPVQGGAEQDPSQPSLAAALGQMAQQLDLDLDAELQGSPLLQQQQDRISQQSLSSILQGLDVLDAQSEQLLSRMQNISAALRDADDSKQQELDELLGAQEALRQGWLVSRDQVSANAQQLKKVLSDITEKPDFVTSLAIFPLKRKDQQLGFVLGLALLLKTLFDLPYFLANDQGAALALQAAASLLGFFHYGLVQAAVRSLTNPTKKS